MRRTIYDIVEVASRGGYSHGSQTIHALCKRIAIQKVVNAGGMNHENSYEYRTRRSALSEQSESCLT